MSVDTRAGVSEALAALERAGRSLAAGALPEPALSELVAASAHGAGAELAALWLAARDGLEARAVWAVSAAHAAELEGMRVESREGAEQLVRGRLDGDVSVRCRCRSTWRERTACSCSRAAAPPSTRRRSRSRGSRRS